MSTTNAPYGLRPINRNDGMPYAGATSQYLINPTSGAGTNLFYGQVVLIDADGYIALSTATGADLTTNNLGGSSIGAWGVFVGAAYINSQGQQIYGADNPDALRGGYLDDATLDEYADMYPGIFGSIIRPMLADRQGTATFIGTPKGRNAFFDLFERAKTDPDWFPRVSAVRA